MTKEELVALVKEVKKRKKYGLVWEDKPEDVVEQCKKELPVLEESKDKAIQKDEGLPTNLIIEGDNYHSLSVLNYTHAGKIDVIYIDPPYNTGAKDWKYNNHYVDSNDNYRHSKWINMMHHRLTLARNLLTEDGILICAIDDNEFANLKLLLEEILPSYTHEVVVVNHHPQGSGGLNISATHEYAIVSVPKGKNLFLGDYIEEVTEEWSLLKAGAGNDYYRIGRPRMFFAILVDKKTGQIKGVGEELKKDEKYPTEDTPEGYKRVYPLDGNGGERRWRYGRETMIDLISKQEIKASLPNLSMKVIKKRSKVYKPVYSNWFDSRYNAGPHGTMFLKKLLPDTDFPFPKSIYTMIDFISYATKKRRQPIILDFFAGSGTTGHAVAILNKKDGLKRQFILCTNNENNIAENVTYKRIKAITKSVSGLEDLTGIPINLRYFKTSFVSKSKVSDDTRKELVKRSTEMICIRENTFEKVLDKTGFKIYKDAKHTTGILFNLDDLDELKKKLKEQNLPASIYVFSLTNDTFNEDFEDLELKHELCPIPESILEVYRKLFK